MGHQTEIEMRTEEGMGEDSHGERTDTSGRLAAGARVQQAETISIQYMLGIIIPYPTSTANSLPWL